MAPNYDLSRQIEHHKLPADRKAPFVGYIKLIMGFSSQMLAELGAAGNLNLTPALTSATSSNTTSSDSGLSSNSMEMTSSSVDTDQAMVFSFTGIKSAYDVIFCDLF